MLNVLGFDGPVTVQIRNLFGVLVRIGKHFLGIRQKFLRITKLTAQKSEVRFWGGVITHRSPRAFVGRHGRQILSTNLFQSFLNGHLSFDVAAFANVIVNNVAVFVDEVFPWPVLVSVELPQLIVRVENHRVLDVVVSDSALDIFRFFFKRKFRGMHADNHKTLVGVKLVPTIQMRLRPNAVHARVCPKIDQDNLASQTF